MKMKKLYKIITKIDSYPFKQTIRFWSKDFYVYHDIYIYDYLIDVSCDTSELIIINNVNYCCPRGFQLKLDKEEIILVIRTEKKI